MRLPKAFVIYGSKIKVIRKLLGDEGGFYTPDPDNTIEICNTLIGDELVRVVTHEFNHAVMDKASLNQTVKDGVDEIIVNQFAKAYRENFVLLPKGLGDKVVKHYAVYTYDGMLASFHTEDSIKNAYLGKGDVVVELYGVAKFKKTKKQ
jgi:hypothetical protein